MSEKKQSIFRDIIENRALIGNLARNDFKQKFAGSVFGIVWAFVQPMVTVLVYWFVFEKALNQGTAATKAGINVPYVLWLLSGLVPWFFFSEVLSAGTNTFVEYNYLVKKVVFKIDTLPLVKVISSSFVHIFFVGFTLVLYSCYHFYPNLYTIQVVYYSLAMMILCLGIIYATSALTVFFRDLNQLVTIVLGVLMWMTPIMWNLDGMVLPKWIEIIVKLNPMYYIVAGYRDALIYQRWFWERPGITLYFWVFTGCMLWFGVSIFKKLQNHFADVL